MARWTRGAVIAAAALSAGCIVTSLNPLFLEADRIAAPELLGPWVEVAEARRWEFAPGLDGAYALTHTDDDGGQGRFTAVVGEVSGRRFVELHPQAPEIPSPAVRRHLQPTYSFMRVEAADATHLVLSPLDREWTEAALNAGAVTLPHLLAGSGLILTASTAELRTFFTEIANADAPFPERIALERP